LEREQNLLLQERSQSDGTREGQKKPDVEISPGQNAASLKAELDKRIAAAMANGNADAQHLGNGNSSNASDDKMADKKPPHMAKASLTSFHSSEIPAAQIAHLTELVRSLLLEVKNQPAMSTLQTMLDRQQQTISALAERLEVIEHGKRSPLNMSR
jgi:hypothetical protein